MKQLTVFLAVLLATAACRTKPIVDLEQISIERTTCYGTCPAYTVTVFGDGRVEYDGKRFVKSKGKREKHIDPKAIRKLRDEIDRISYFDLRDSYASAADGCPTVWTDNPAVITSVRANGKTKKIHHYLGCQEIARPTSLGKSYPQALTIFEDTIDTIAGTGEWIGTPQERARSRD